MGNLTTIVPELVWQLPDGYQPPPTTTVTALDWLETFGSQALKAPAQEVVKNLLQATSPALQERGLAILARAIFAQNLWLAGFPLLAPCGRVEQLKKLTSAIREAETLAELDTAKEEGLKVYLEFEARVQEASILIDKIGELVKEEAFIASCGPKLLGWQRVCLKGCKDGKGLRHAPKSLNILASRLDALAQRFFGEGAFASKPKKRKKPRSHKSHKWLPPGGERGR